MRCIPYKSEKGEYSSHIFWRNENGDFYSFNDQPAYRDNNGFSIGIKEVYYTEITVSQHVIDQITKG